MYKKYFKSFDGLVVFLCMNILWKLDVVSLYFLVLCYFCEFDWFFVFILSLVILFGFKFKEFLKNMYVFLMLKILVGKLKFKKCFVVYIIFCVCKEDVVLMWMLGIGLLYFMNLYVGFVLLRIFINCCVDFLFLIWCICCWGLYFNEVKVFFFFSIFFGFCL